MSTPFLPVVIHHNPDFGTPQNVLGLIREASHEPIIIAYLEAVWRRPQLQALSTAAGLTAREAIRTTKMPAAELGLLDPTVSEQALLTAMIEHPVLVNRPIVATPRGVRLCRPSERTLELLEKWPSGPFAKEDGELVIDETGRRVS